MVASRATWYFGACLAPASFFFGRLVHGVTDHVRRSELERKKKIIWGVTCPCLQIGKRQTVLLAFLCTLAVPLALARQENLSYKYNIACDKIIANAQKTAKYHNEHQPVLAAKAEAELFSQFDKAISFKPNEPQAYMSVAQFLSNSHKFDRSIAMWNKVLPLLPKDRPELRPMIEANIKHCK